MTLQVPKGWNGIVYVADGAGSICGTKAQREQVFSNPLSCFCCTPLKG